MRILLVVIAAAFGLAIIPAVREIPRGYRGPYGDAVVAPALDGRHVTNVVAAVAYDIRGFDTLGEELILFASVVGVSVLLRPHGARHRESRGVDRAGLWARGEHSIGPGVKAASVNVLALALAFGLYMTLHATQTPGGGFQGGAIIASGIALVYFGGGYTTWARSIREPAFDIGETAGVIAFLALVAVPLAWGGALCANWMGLGSLGKLGSGGTMFVINLGIGVAVAAGFTLLLHSALHELHEAEDA